MIICDTKLLLDDESLLVVDNDYKNLSCLVTPRKDRTNTLQQSDFRIGLTNFYLFGGSLFLTNQMVHYYSNR